jgi:hypothetical protein
MYTDRSSAFQDAKARMVKMGKGKPNEHVIYDRRGNPVVVTVPDRD